MTLFSTPLWIGQPRLHIHAVALGVTSALLIAGCASAPLEKAQEVRADSAAVAARAEAAEQRRELEEARDANVEARRDALQMQSDQLQAEITDRGLVLTLGDVLFASNTAELNADGIRRLDQLAVFLGKYPQRNALIEGYTDSIGNVRDNHTLSERRAEAVKMHLVRRGVPATRLTASGDGESSPLADNDSAVGRQQNRRVEVIIEDVLTSRSHPVAH